MDHAIQCCRKPKSEHARDCMQSVGNDNPTCKTGVDLRKFRSQSPEKSVMGESDCEVVTENSVVVSNSSRHYNNNSSSSSLCHVCRFCNRAFSSGKALGGHVRIHGAGRSNGRSSGMANVSMGDYSSTGNWVKKSKVPTKRSNRNSNWVRADSIEEEEGEAEEEEEADKVAKNMKMDIGQEELVDRNTISLYTLRRNPKRSRRVIDEEFCLDLTANNSRVCVECGKEFSSSKALFGHMRCHPEREWRGIQPPNDNNTNSTDDEVVHAAVPSSGLSSVCWQSSQGSEDLEEHGEDETAASDNESDRESLKSMKAAHQPDSRSLLTWSVTAKRGRRRPISSTQPPQGEDGEKEEEEAEVHNAKELEDDRDTAHFLVMLACSATDTNDTNKVDRHVQRQMTDESVYHSGTVKGTFEVLEAGLEDPGWKKKLKKRNDKSSRPVELGAGKYKCSTCKKLLNSHQALVRHRSSHKKVKGCNDEVNEEEINEECSSVLMTEYLADAGDVMASSYAREEGEKIDNLSQELSPALAVVMKGSHWTGENRVTESTNSVISTKEQSKANGGHARNVRQQLFDLNEPAQVDEEDLQGAYGMVEVDSCLY